MTLNVSDRYPQEMTLFNHLQTDISSLDQWSIHNDLRFNISKCNLLSITRKRDLIELSYNRLEDGEINQFNSSKDLGIYLTNKLQWSKQVTVATGRATEVLNIVKIICGNHLDTFSKRSLYTYLALVRSHLGYASEIWSPYLHKDMATLEKVQRRAATKYILNDHNLCYTDRLMKLSLLPISYWHEQKDLCTLNKLLSNAYEIKTSTYVSAKLVKESHVIRPTFTTPLFKNVILQEQLF